jgi:hypothetical protein
MQIGKIVISFLLLLTYSLGFAHNLIPHCQKFYSVESNSHQEKEKEKHHHEDLSSDHEHIQHEGHYDEDLYDLLVCFLNEMEHPANDCNVEHCFPARTNDASSKVFAKAKFITALLTVIAHVDESEQTSDYGSDSDAIYLSPPIDDSPHRGPPSLSC